MRSIKNNSSARTFLTNKALTRLKSRLNFSKIKETIDYPKHMSEGLAKKFIENYSKISTSSTPLKDVCLPDYGHIKIKDEGFNTHQTAKRRIAAHLAKGYHDYANYVLKNCSKRGDISEYPAFRISVITSGNMGYSLALLSKELELPPFKLLINSSVDSKIVDRLKRFPVDIYMADLDKFQLSSEQILALTNNSNGYDITSIPVSDQIPFLASFYENLPNELLNENPDMIFVPVGSARLMESIVLTQYWAKLELEGRFKRIWDWTEYYSELLPPSDTIKILPEELLKISVIGTEPKEKGSKADKLTKLGNPFQYLDDESIDELIYEHATGVYTQIFSLSEKYIERSYNLLTHAGLKTSYSGAAGLCGYLFMVDQGIIEPDEKKILVVNTGRGI